MNSLEELFEECAFLARVNPSMALELLDEIRAALNLEIAKEQEEPQIFKLEDYRVQNKTAD